MKRGTLEHHKMDELAAAILDRWPMAFEHAHGIAVSTMEKLWHAAARYFPRGDIGKMPSAWVARRLGWIGDASDLLEVLVACRWIDRHPEHGLVVHDWTHHADDAVHIALARARQFFADGTAPKRARISGEERKQLDLFYEFQTPDGMLIESGAPGSVHESTDKISDSGQRASQLGEVTAENVRAHGVRTACAQEAHCPSFPRLAQPSPGESPDARAGEVSPPEPEETGPPERLTDDQREEMRSWALEHEPWSVHRLCELEHACLDSPSSKSKISDDWPQIVREWIRRQPSFERSRQSFPPGDPVVERGARPVTAVGGDRKSSANLEAARLAREADPPQRETIRAALDRYRRAPPREQEQPP